ncbi:EF-P beta-lysylation protein EpmB|uniref:L-lysine 2,3-aminomutase n=2 Tax=Brenneria salicis TaxID=55214 RepID=A0A366I1H6_9GAMM|nr:EF-P beta-lysylation protein EpmB [Brenneria salicis ATCC 15712 = DSM 30166]RBP59633.1 L-lysine 2,3-aminomutase [Brenneria salicis ATCC 15712 = DSM 30166]
MILVLSQKMAHIVTLNIPSREDWLQQLADVITDPEELLQLLALGDNARLRQGHDARRLFPLRVPRAFAARMQKGNASDPLLQQVLTSRAEFIATPGFSHDPLDEQHSVVPGLLHKYHNRALLLVKGGCAVNCRYCFRRHFPYQDNQGNKTNWRQALDYIQAHPELDEIIFSGGDPLMAKDQELAWLITALEKIPHLKRLRIHTRLPVVIPARITDTLCQRLSQTSLQVLLVTHINHPQEIDPDLTQSMARLRRAGVTLLNQSVLLRGVNDNADTLANLSNALFDIGILPYYLHVLDKVQGAAHFMVSDDEARSLVKALMKKVSGYLVPRLAREIGGEASKTPLDLRLRQSQDEGE